MLKIEKFQDTAISHIDFVKMPYKSGIKILLKEGYSPCKNPYYYENDKTILHYNKILKVWIVEYKREK